MKRPEVAKTLDGPSKGNERLVNVLCYRSKFERVLVAARWQAKPVNIDSNGLKLY